MIAELGLEIDSSQAAPAAAALDKLTASASTATAAAARLTAAGAAANDTLNVVDLSAARAAKAHGSLSTQAMAAGHAVRSSIEMLAQGVPVTQVLAMHLNQLSYAATGPGGLKGAFAEVGGVVAKLLGPTGLIALGVGAGVAATAGVVYGYYKSVSDPAPTAEAILKEQVRIVGLVKDAYKDAKNAAGQFNNEVQSAMIVDAKVNLMNLQTQLTDFAKNFKNQVPTQLPIMTGAEGAGQQMPTVGTKYAPYQKAIDDFAASARAGKPDVDAFENSVSKLGLSDPSLLKSAHDLLESGRTAEDYAGKIKHVQASLDLLQGHGTAADRSVLGLSNHTSEAAKAFTSLVRATQDQVAEFQFQADNAGTSSSAIQGLRKEHELLRTAVKSGIVVDQDRAASIHALAQSLTDAAQAAAVAKAKFGDDFARSMLGLDDASQRVAETMRNIYGSDWQSHMDDAVAGQMRMTQAMSEAKGVATSFMSSFNSDLVKGTLNTQTLVSALQGLGIKLLDLAENQAISALFGGSFLGGLFGGGGGGVLPGGTPLGMGGIGHNATGTDNWSGGPTWVGEKGPEIVNLPAGARVTPNNKVAAMMAGGGGSQPIQVTVAPVYTFNNADPQVEARLRQQIAQSAADTQQKTITAVSKLSQNSPGNYLPPKR